jgi:glycosyltransferase involved in cell wall biosynthesis
MVRVLLLSGRDADLQTVRATEALSLRLGDGFAVRHAAIGDGDTRNGLAAVRWVRRHATGADIVHAFGADALTAVAMGFAGRVLYSPIEFPSRKEIQWLRAVASYRDVQAVLATSTQHKAVVTAGGVVNERCHLIRPGADFAAVRRRRDDALRARLGFGPDDLVILLNGESTRGAAHEGGAWAAGILHFLDPRVRLLVWGRGPRGARIARYARNIVADQFAGVATARIGPGVVYESLMSAADLVLVSATGPVATLPVAIAMAAALPIVSTVTYTVAELLEDRHTALMTTNATPAELARRIQDLRADAGLQWSIADAARAEAYEHFSLTRFLNEYRTLYRQVATGAPVALGTA